MIGRAVKVIERRIGGYRGIVVLSVKADFRADEHKTVLTLPELKHIACAFIVELEPYGVIIHYGKTCRIVIQRVKAEVLLP